jgi:hypothetical protein
MNPHRPARLAQLFTDRQSSHRRAVLAAPAVKVEYLFVQSFRSGSMTPKAGEDGTFELTLDNGLGHTVYFSDRPERVVGTAATAQFLKTFPFGVNNPPNAALVLEAGSDDAGVVVMELTEPNYDEATQTATYAARVIAGDDKLAVKFQQTSKDAGEIRAEFGAASLFIDDCPDLVDCFHPWYHAVGPIPGGPYGRCWDWDDFHCDACSGQDMTYYDGLCNDAYSDCEDQCGVT